MIGDRIYIFYSEVFEIILSENNYDWMTFKDEYVNIYLAWTEILEPVLIKLPGT